MKPISTRISRKFSWFVFGVVVAGGMGGAVFYAFSQPRLYQSTAMLQFSGGPDKLSASGELADDKTLDFGEISAGYASKAFINEVAERLVKSEDLPAFLKPYGYPANTSVAAVEKVLLKNSKTVSHPEAKIIEITYRHPDPAMASKMAKELGFRWESSGNRESLDAEMRAIQYGCRQEELQRALVKADVSLLGFSRDAHAADAEPAGRYQNLSRQLEDDQAILNNVTKNRRQFSGGLQKRAHLSFHFSPPASAGRYLLSPIISNLGWGFSGALIIGTVAGFVFRRSTGGGPPSKGRGRILRENLRRPIQSRDVVVFSLVFLATVTLAVYHAYKQPRIYQSSVTLAVSEVAKDYGWDELRASDFASWLPVITQRVAMRLTDDYDRPPAVLKSYGLDGGADLSAIESELRRN